ncbi:MAG: hypothetical protein GX175_09105 [Halanaerobiaceae bacterium]|jgi:hypothetical protein|nr:hypothetical protein [Halanaerobiaceae bacterium]
MAGDIKKRSRKSLSKEEKEKIAEAMIEGYKKMAKLNLEIAEEGMTSPDETD